jgi:hypothetical protein
MDIYEKPSLEQKIKPKNRLFWKKNFKNNQGKLLSILIILVFLVPLFITYLKPYNFFFHSVLGVRTETNIDTKGARFELPKMPLIDALLNPPSSKVEKKPSQYDYTIEKPLDQPRLISPNNSIVEPDRSQENKTKVARIPIKTQIKIANQANQAIGNTKMTLNQSYDLTIGSKTTKVLINKIDPEQAPDNMIAINLEIAKRLGIEVKETVYLEGYIND